MLHPQLRRESERSSAKSRDDLQQLIEFLCERLVDVFGGRQRVGWRWRFQVITGDRLARNFAAPACAWGAVSEQPLRASIDYHP
jgi:hypothetical protein